MQTNGAHKNNMGRAEKRMPLKMGKIRLQTEPCEGESEERPLAPFVSLGHASKAGMIPVGCVGAASHAGEKRSDSDVMTDAATAPTHDEWTPEEVELFERARRCEEANLLDVWGGAPPARSIIGKAPGLFTATSLPPEKASPPQRRRMASDTLTPSAHDDHDSGVGNARGSSRSLLQRAAAVQGSTRPTDGGMTRTASGASSGTSRVPSACAAQPPSHAGVEKLASWSYLGPGRGTSDACRGGRMLRQRIGSSSARSRGKSAVNRKECAGIACEECSALRRELDFLKHVITTRSLPSESSPGTTGAGVGADMGLPPTGHSPSSSSRMSPLETRVHIIPSNPSQQTHLPSPTFVPRPPPCGLPSSSSEGSFSSNARPSTGFNSRGHSACTKTSWVAPIFLENGQGHRAESRNSMIARQRRASNPSSADELADEQVHFSRTGSLDGGISSAPRPCAPRRVALSPDGFFTLFLFPIRGMPLLHFQLVSFLPSLPSSSCPEFPPLNQWRALSQHFEAFG